MTDSRILVLGAGRGQVGLIRAAKNLGVETLVASLPSDTAPGLELADRVVHVDISDAEAVERVARENGVTAIATSCADTGVPAIGRVCDSLGLVGLSARAAQICADKSLMKAAFMEAGVRTAQYRSVSSRDELDGAIADLGFPLIIKATDLQGSLGIVIVRNAEEAAAGFEHAMSATRRDYLIVEQFIEGDEFGAQALVHQGEIVFVLPHGDEVLMAKTAVPVGHSVPLLRSSDFLASAVEETSKAIRAIGLDNCAVNVDLIARGDEIFIIELTGRVGANGLPEMVSGHYGIDYYETVARLALGQDPTGPWKGEGSHGSPAVAVRMVAAPDLHGTVESIHVDESIVPDAEYLVFRRQGDRIDGFTNSGDCVGQVTVTAETLDDALRKLDAAESAIKITVV